MAIKEKINVMTGGSRNVLIICGTVMFCFVMATAVAIERITNDNATALSLIVILLGSLAPTIAALALVVKGESMKQTAEDTNAKVDRVLNGEMAAKIKKAYKEALDETGRTPVTHPRATRSRTD
jgi:hypothetical protein